MRLSEAIKAGAKLRPQAIGGYFKPCCADQCLGSCAWGAAFEGAFGNVTVSDILVADKTRDEWPFVFTTVAACPECDITVVDHIGGLIVHLNDDHTWQREDIADWVATVEPSTPEALDLPSPSSSRTTE